MEVPPVLRIGARNQDTGVDLRRLHQDVVQRVDDQPPFTEACQVQVLDEWRRLDHHRGARWGAQPA
jgi:hypothetical protein